MNRPEQAIQRSIAAYLRLALPSGWIIDSKGSIADGPKMGGIRKSMGARAGMPDLCIMGRIEDRPYLGFLEVKAPGGRRSPEQIECHDRLTDIGWDVATVRSIEETEAALRTWGVPLRVSA